MNKVILMGRLTKDTEVRYSQSAEPIAIARYSLAVNRRFKKDGDADADFINCVAFGKAAEFAEKYFQKGQQVSVVGRIQTGSYEDKDGNKKYTTDVVVEEQFFAESKRSLENGLHNQLTSKPEKQAPSSNSSSDNFSPIETNIDNDLPF